MDLRNRCLLSLLICGVLLYYALPHLTLSGTGMETYFSWAWLSFLLMAIAGNLAAVLYVPKRRRKTARISKEKVRSYQN